MIVARFIAMVARISGCRLVKQRLGMRASKKLVWLCLTTGLLLSNLLLTSCTGLFSGNSTPAPTAAPAALTLAKLHWCRKPAMVFRDEGAVPSPTARTTATPGTTATAATTPSATGTAAVNSTPTAPAVPGKPRTVTDWSEVRANLGFAVYLPPTLPRNACLVSAQATIHDPIVGGSFTLGYLLPDHSALTLSEARLISQNTAFQCNSSNGATTQTNSKSKAGTPTPTSSSTQVATFLCSGAKNTTNIVMSARGSVDDLQHIFNTLQPDITWIPAS
jgi:hypothetical protein